MPIQALTYTYLLLAANKTSPPRQACLTPSRLITWERQAISLYHLALLQAFDDPLRRLELFAGNGVGPGKVR